MSLQLLIDELHKCDDVTPIVIETGNIRGHGIRSPFRFVQLLLRLTKATRQADALTLHLCPLAIPVLGPFALLIARVFRKPIVLRLFGGQDFRDFPGPSGWMQRWVSKRCDVYLAQTQRLLRSAKDAGIKNLEWYPTSRPDPQGSPIATRTRCTRFAYLGWVKSTKGVPLILEAAQDIAEDIAIDIYGPFDGMSEEDFVGHDHVHYCGIIPAGESITRLGEYDALILPTHWEGEGYPGVVLEAYLAGIPVITTRWRDIPEIVDDSCGIMIEPHSSSQLRAAIQSLYEDTEKYQRMVAGAIEKGSSFKGSVWAQKLVEICQATIARR